LLLLMFLGFISTWHGLYGSCYFIYCVHMYIYFVCRNYTTSEKVGTRVWAVISNFCNLLYHCDILHDYFSVNFHQTCKLSYQWNITGLITHLGYCFSAGHAVVLFVRGFIIKLVFIQSYATICVQIVLYKTSRTFYLISSFSSMLCGCRGGTIFSYC